MSKIEYLRAPALQGAPHGFFLATGGVSRGCYASLNCGLGSADDRMAVIENRRRVAQSLGVAPHLLLTLRQTHSARAVLADEAWPGDAPEADAIVTRTRGLAIAALSADCVPILMMDLKAGVVAAVHAGWRGALYGVAEATVAAMTGLGACAGRIRAALGPCIGPAAYEVGEDFRSRFIREDPASEAFFKKGEQGSVRFDLPNYVVARLGSAGVAGAEWAGPCTYSDRRCFSHRRSRHEGQDDYGRMISVIRLP